ncbi:DUF4282 domain-containing protein [Sutcliffiella horikoshii]|uniref:DUF4282 domain-containing protein n=1 Tax=Sutcliffiella horikoshii TaxID=79883 RepID=UPI003CE9A15D
MQEFLSFDKMITPTLIKIIFYIGCALSVIGGIIMIISGVNSYYGGGAQVFMGIVLLFLGPFLTRIYCELLIVQFKMQEHLAHIRKTSDTNQNL